jgi:hypothetical protein
MPGRSLFSEIAQVVGAEVASTLELGEPIEGEDAWLVLDYLLENKPVEVVDEEEVVEGGECYHVALVVEGSYLFYLLKTGRVSRCVLIEVGKNRVESVLDEVFRRLGKCGGEG